MTPPVITPPPLPRVRPLIVAGWLLGVAILFFSNVFLAFLGVRARNLNAMGDLPYSFGYSFGYLMGNLLVPFVAILGICAAFRSNRRPYRLLQCSFWILLGLLIIHGQQWISVMEKVSK